MTAFSPQLLGVYTQASAGARFNAVHNAHGVYSTHQFVLRLSPLVHARLAAEPPGISTNGALSFEAVQAMSTFLHETVHWWQHIGSTYGFIFGLNYPMQSHSTFNDLKALTEKDGFQKSVLQRAEVLGRTGPSGFGTTAGLANTIVNNHYDLLTFRAFTLGPEQAKSVVRTNLFQAVGHAMEMTYGHTINILASTVDPTFKTFGHPKEWEPEFKALRDQKKEGYYYGSRVTMLPFGAHEIFEGQARFAQLQYLSASSGHRYSWEDYRQLGMLGPIYIHAFQQFLDYAEAQWPENVDDPLVGLFLLVCDLAINPSSGFPFSIAPRFETFIDDVTPAMRFARYSRLIALKYPEMKSAISKHDKNEYESISSELSEALGYLPPLETARACADWFKPAGVFGGLRAEYEAYRFGHPNFVIRHLFAHFLAFQEDKASRPEFFCWPGAWLVGDQLTGNEVRLFDKHGAPFVDKEMDDSVFARLQHGRSEQAVQETFDTFYQNAVLFDLTDQWISRPGPFSYDISWLARNASIEESKSYLQRQFQAAFGLNLEAAKILG